MKNRTWWKRFPRHDRTGKENVISREEYFTLEDLVEIKKRLIGTGFIGGKSVGMLLARNILRKDPTFDWDAQLELHDSFYIGSDIFYSYMVQNGWWKLLMEQKTDEGYFKVARELKEKMLHGVFPDEVKEQFLFMLEYFGQSRLSSVPVHFWKTPSETLCRKI